MTEDLGAPASYLTCGEGTPVYGSDAVEVGQVAHVLADEDADVFDGIVIKHDLGHHLFADADQVDEIYERGVVLTLSGAEAEALPRPSANPATLEATPDDTVPDRLGDKLRRAWDLLSGNY